MTKNRTFGNEISKKKTTTQDILEYIPGWTPGVTPLKDMRKRIEGTSKKKTKREIPWGEYE